MISKLRIIWKQESCALYAYQLLAGAAHCHQRGVCHRDLKLENLLLDSTGKRLMIADFGFAQQFGLGEAPKTCIGTAAYVAPEVLSLEPYDGAKVDSWACGVVLFLMLTGEYPFGIGNACGGSVYRQSDMRALILYVNLSRACF